MRHDLVLVLLTYQMCFGKHSPGHIWNNENLFLFLTSSYRPFQNANTHSLLCFHHFVRKVSVNLILFRDQCPCSLT